MNRRATAKADAGVDVLVVEDETRLCEMVLRALPEMGLTGVGASGVEEARRLLDNREVRTLLLDIRLAGADGLSFLESLRRGGDDRPAVIMTAFADLPSAQRAIRSGAADYVVKPFTLAELEKALDRAGRQASDPSRTMAQEIVADSEPPESVDELRRQALHAALERAGGNKMQAAKTLGISRRTLYNWLERFTDES